MTYEVTLNGHYLSDQAVQTMLDSPHYPDTPEELQKFLDKQTDEEE